MRKQNIALTLKQLHGNLKANYLETVNRTVIKI